MSFDTRTNSEYTNLKSWWDEIYNETRQGQRLLADHVAAYTWDDLRSPATGINPPGAVSDPDVDSTTGHLLFDKNGTEIVAIQLQMSHTWVPGTAIHPHIHWYREADGDVRWTLQYKVSAVGGEVPAAYTTISTDSSIFKDSYNANSPLVDLHDISAFPAIDMSGYTPAATGGGSVSIMLDMRVGRVGGASPDDYDQDARFLEFDIHFQSIGHGSFLEFSRDLPID